MLKIFLTAAFRNLNKNKGYTLLNILGLAAGLTCFAFITVWVKDEWSYDKFNEKSDRIFRVAGHIITQAEEFQHACSSVPMAQAFKADFPEVEDAVRFDKTDAIVELGGKQFKEENILATDPSFFNVFSYSLTKGNAKTALNNPYRIILTESMAKKYFGNEDPLGKTLNIFLYDTSGKGELYMVSGVMPDPPKNAHFSFDFLVSFKSLEVYNPRSTTPDGWDNNSYYTYLLLKDKSSRQSIEGQLDNFLKRHKPFHGQHNPENKTVLFLQPLTSIHLNSHLRYEIEPNGNAANIYIFLTVGFFILIIAAINYMNLATARSVSRAREVAVKKVLGAGKKQLVFQHLTESVMVAMISFIVALLISVLVNPLFAQLTGKEANIASSPALVLLLGVLSFFIGLLAGLYPAFYITAYKPVEALKGALKSGNEGVWLRKSLVVFQFAIAVVLIAGIVIINSQLRFISTKDLGYGKDALISLRVNGNADVIKGYDAFKNEILRNPLIKNAAVSNSLIVGGLGNSGARTVDGKGQKIETGTYRLVVDPSYIDVYDMKIVAGRNFYQNYPADSSSYIVNEALVQKFGWANNNDAINKPFEMNGRNGRVVGVVRNFHFNTLQHPIEPLVLRFVGSNFSQITLKAELKEPQKTIAAISDIWKKHFPGALLEYGFVEKKLEEQYQSEKRFSQYFLYFSILALIIACLGLLGLTSYSIQQRVKEIGIRKVLGASVKNITIMLSKDLLLLVLLAGLIAFPIAWWAMNQWLQDFAYRIQIQWWVFILALFIAVMIALLTVSFQAIKAAIANPVKSLRTE